MARNIVITSRDGIILNTRKKYVLDDIAISLDESLIPSGTLEINENGLHNVAQYESVNVDVQTGVDTTDATATADDILLGKTAYVNGEKVEGVIETYDYLSEGATFEGSGQLREILDGTKKTSYLFESFPNESVDGLIYYNDTENVTSMSYMFNSSSIVSAPEMNTGNVTTMMYMFNGNANLETVPLYNTSKVSTFQRMFYGCKKLKEIPHFDTSSATSFNYMCTECESLESFPLLDTSKATDMSGMLYRCRLLTTIPHFNTGNVTTLASFVQDTAITEFPLLDTSNVKDISYCFDNCKQLKTLPLLDTSKVTTMSYMCWGCSSLEALPNFDYSSLTSASYAFCGCSSLETVPDLYFPKLTSLGNTFDGCTKLKKININAPLVNNLYYSFSNCESLEQAKITSSTNLTRTQNTCYRCYNLILADLPNYSVSSATYSGNMAAQCYKLRACIIRSFGSNYALSSTAFSNTYHILGVTNTTHNPEGLQDGYIYVPRNMIETLSQTTNWTTVATQFRALEDYTLDGTTTGDLDLAKMGLEGLVDGD